MILQDDSGIPFAYFNPQNWRLQAFGRYVGPISQFAHHNQPQLSQLSMEPAPYRFTSGSAIAGAGMNQTFRLR